jgi:hypothetical protein
MSASWASLNLPLVTRPPLVKTQRPSRSTDADWAHGVKQSPPLDDQRMDTSSGPGITGPVVVVVGRVVVGRVPGGWPGPG